MPYYESTFIARQDVPSQQVETLAQKFADVVVENGGSVTKTEYWGLRTLAYRIKKNRKGHYVMFNIDGPPATVHELERNLRIHEDVLRYLTVRVEALDPNPSVIKQFRAARDERAHREPKGDSGGTRPVAEGKSGEAKGK
ncbi:MAG: 30S ribosomal protein S6, partial [Alphaproteobacteria bacterium]